MPSTIDNLVGELHSSGQKVDSKKLINLVVKDEERRNTDTLARDPTTMEPHEFVGQRVSKLFDGVVYEGDVVSNDIDMLGNKLVLIRYLDGDEEDMFFE